MTADTGSGGAPAPEDPAESKPRSFINQEKVDKVTLTRQQLMIILGNAVMLAKMAEHGYSEPVLKTGLDLVAEAEGAIQDKQAGRAPATEKKTQCKAFEKEIRAEFMKYRKTVRARFKNREVWKGLGATGRVQKDLQKFKPQVESAYQAAFAEPFASELAKRGWTADRLHAAKAKPAKLITLANAFQVAEGDKERNTDAFEAAFAAMEEWAKEFRVHAKIAFRGDRASLEALKLKK